MWKRTKIQIILIPYLLLSLITCNKLHANLIDFSNRIICWDLNDDDDGDDDDDDKLTLNDYI